MLDEDLETKINNFFTNPQLTITYKIVFFKAILNWCQDVSASDTLLLSLDSIAGYFIKTYAHYYQNREIHHLTNHKKVIDFFNLLDKINYDINDALTDDMINFLLEDAKKIILQDVIYRFRNNCCIYDFVKDGEKNIEKINLECKITEDDYVKIKSSIRYIKFEKITVNWLKRNHSVLNSSLNYLMFEFLSKLNEQAPLKILKEFLQKI